MAQRVLKHGIVKKGIGIRYLHHLKRKAFRLLIYFFYSHGEIEYNRLELEIVSSY